MDGSTKGGTLLVVIAVLAGLALLVFGLRTERVVTESPPEYAYDPATDGARGPVVVSTAATGGFSFFGLQLSDQDHTVSVRFLAPPGCAALLTGDDRWPNDAAACQTPYSVVGTVDGTGTTADGRSLIGVAISVTPECAAAVDLGSVWPPDFEACR